MSLSSWFPVTIPAGSPGELGGPGVAIVLRVTNASSQPLDLTNVVVDLRYGRDQLPAIRAERSPTEPFSGRLDAGQTQTATYAFRLDEDDRARVRVLVRLDGASPVVVFRGDISA